MAQVLSPGSTPDTEFTSASSGASPLVPIIATACLACRAKHLKCDGASPCSRCTSSGAECIYVGSRRGYKGPRRTLGTASALPQLTTSKADEATFLLKPRLTKENVDQLETAFSKDPKPSSSYKTELSIEMGVEVARINNWFQNRRAKEKQQMHIARHFASSSRDSPDSTRGAREEESCAAVLTSDSPDTFQSPRIQTSLVAPAGDEERSGPDDIPLFTTALASYQDSHGSGKHHDVSSGFSKEKNPELRSPLPESIPVPVPAKRSFNKQEAVSRLMNHFYSLMGQWYFQRSLRQPPGTGIIQAVHNTSGNTSSNRNYAPSGSDSGRAQNKRATSNTGKSSFIRPERPFSGDGDDNSDDNEDDEREKDERRHKKPRLKDKEKTELPSERLACPYFKRNPGTYRHWRSCPGPGWGTVHRVKEHLYRCHLLPPSCPRCHETFATEKAKLEHLVSPEPCTVIRPGQDSNTQPLVEGLDPPTHELLRSRKLLQGQDTEVMKWRAVYLAIFPDTEEGDIPSPYYEYRDITAHDHHHQEQQLTTTTASISTAITSEFAAYERFLQAELPSHIRQKLTARVEVATTALDPRSEVDLLNEIVDMVRDAQLELFRLYRGITTLSAAAAAVTSSQKHRPPTPESTTASLAAEEPVPPDSWMTLPGGFGENRNSRAMYHGDDDNNISSEPGLNNNNLLGTSPTMEFDFGGAFDGVVFDLSGVLESGNDGNLNGPSSTSSDHVSLSLF